MHGGQHSGGPLGGSCGGALPAFHSPSHSSSPLNRLLPGGYKVGYNYNLAIIINVVSSVITIVMV